MFHAKIVKLTKTIVSRIKHEFLSFSPTKSDFITFSEYVKEQRWHRNLHTSRKARASTTSSFSSSVVQGALLSFAPRDQSFRHRQSINHVVGNAGNLPASELGCLYFLFVCAIDIALSHGCVCVLLPVSCCVSSSFPQYPDL